MGRDPERIVQATREIEAAVAAPGNFTMLQADLSLLSDLRAARRPRLGLPEDIAAATPAWCSDDAGYITCRSSA